MGGGSRFAGLWGRRAVTVGAAAAIGSATAFGTLALSGERTAVVTTVATAQHASLQATPALTANQVYVQDAPGVVDIVATLTRTDPFGNVRTAKSEGSGFVIDTKGDIVTNAHVIEGASSITVAFRGGGKAIARIVGTSASTDIAVIRVSTAAGKLHPLTIGNSNVVKVGDQVYAIGSPFGYPASMTAGIVSAVSRTIEAPNGATVKKAIQTDAAINPGNSGGPLLDSSGLVIGVNAQISSLSNGSEGVAFAIASNTAKAAATQILAGSAV
jgi:putative serine protease PepD